MNCNFKLNTFNTNPELPSESRVLTALPSARTAEYHPIKDRPFFAESKAITLVDAAADKAARDIYRRVEKRNSAFHWFKNPSQHWWQHSWILRSDL